MLKTFSIGGVHPHENKLSAHQPIITAEVPAKAVILLGQHIGAPAKPIVAKGDVVKVGTRIAEPAGFVSAAISFSRTLLFQIAAVMILPLIIGINGIWLAIVAAEALAIIVSAAFFIAKKKKYKY